MTADRIFEVEWLLWHLFRKNIYSKIHKQIVDVGAGDGLHQSNSYAFIEMGWKALLIDGLESNIDKCKKLHVARPFVKCICAVVSDKTELVNFEADSRFWALSQIDYSKVPNVETIPLSSILLAAKVRKIGVMSIDLEGHETAVLNDIILHNILPQVLIVEANEPWMAEEHKKILADSYLLVGGINPNNFFVRRDLKW